MVQLYKAEIEINSSPQKVRQAFLDFNSYSQWSKFIQKVEILPAGNKEDGNNTTTPVVGDYLKVILKPQESSPMTMTPVVLENDENQFAWKGTLGISGIFDGEHRFEFQPVQGSDGTKTRLVQSEVFSGILVGPLLWFVGKQTQEGFEAYNKAIKERVEGTN